MSLGETVRAQVTLLLVLYVHKRHQFITHSSSVSFLPYIIIVSPGYMIFDPEYR